MGCRVDDSALGPIVIFNLQGIAAQ